MTAAGECVATVARALADPDRIAAVTAGTAIDLGNGRLRAASDPVSLHAGGAGLAVLYGELAHADPTLRATAHRHLSAAASGGTVGGGSLHAGVTSLAFAARAGARSPADYRSLLSTVDTHVADEAAALVAAAARRRAAGELPTWGEYDVIGGLTGIGRYLLGAGGDLTGVLPCLVALTEPAGGRPGWWVEHSADGPDDTAAGGHANLGLAHGIAGPLALLSLAWRAGHRVAGQPEAIGRVVDWLLAHRQADAAGPYWPAVITRDGAPKPAHQPSWCYGSVGIANAVRLAALALDRPDWCRAAHAAVRAEVARMERGPRLREAMLCHGRAGLLQMLWRFNAEPADPVIARAVDAVAGTLVADLDPAVPFGYRVDRLGDSRRLDLPGLLEGAAGVALALHTYATGAPPATGWDAALLLA
jgi:hypothetical protein